MATFVLKDGETITHIDLQGFLDLGTARKTKERIEELDIPYFKEGGLWVMATEDVRIRLRHHAKSHSERKLE